MTINITFVEVFILNMAIVSKPLNIWMLVAFMFYWTNGLLLHNEGDLFSAYQTLSQQVQTMETKMTSMETEMTTKMSSLEYTIHKLQNTKGSSGNGAHYVRWGRTTCPNNGTSLLYEGYAGGSGHRFTGGAANTLCLPTNPQWDNYEDSVSSGGSNIHGAEYELWPHSNGGSNYFGRNVQNEDVPCAVCSTLRSDVLMVPARLDCYPGWTKEYSGYLMSGERSHPSATEFICVDKQVEVIKGGHNNLNGRLFYLVEGSCGPLKCPPYFEGRELTCVVCTK